MLLSNTGMHRLSHLPTVVLRLSPKKPWEMKKDRGEVVFLVNCFRTRHRVLLHLVWHNIFELKIFGARLTKWLWELKTLARTAILRASVTPCPTKQSAINISPSQHIGERIGPIHICQNIREQNIRTTLAVKRSGIVYHKEKIH